MEDQREKEEVREEGAPSGGTPVAATPEGVRGVVDAQEMAASFHYIFHEDIEGLDVERCPRFFRLPERPQQFILQYLFGLRPQNAAYAYSVAYEPKGGDGQGQYGGAYRVLKSSRVRSALLEVLAAVGIKRERVQLMIARQAIGGDIADFEPYLSGKMDLRQLRNRGVNTRALKKARRTVEKDGSQHYLIELYDPLPALQTLAKILGMTSEQMDVKVSGGLDYSGMSEEELRKLEHATAARLALRKQMEDGASGNGGNGRGLAPANTDVLTGTTEPKW